MGIILPPPTPKFSLTSLTSPIRQPGPPVTFKSQFIILRECDEGGGRERGMEGERGGRFPRWELIGGCFFNSFLPSGE